MFRLLFLLFALFSLPSTSTHAGECSDCDRSLAPRLWIPDGDAALDQLPLKSSQAEIRINGPIAQVTVTQRYGNAGKRPINARYVFPGSTRAAVHGLSMKIGDRVVRARIKEKEEAAKLFEAGKREGKRAALLEQQRPNVFSMDVANIQPGDDIELTLTYSELLVPEQGVYELVYPTVVGPRYGGDPVGGDPVQAAPDAKWIANPYAANTAEGANPAAVKTGVRVTLDSPVAIKELRSLQHQIETHWDSDKAARIELSPSETQAGNRDFILRFRLQDNHIVTGLMTFQQDGENHFLMMAQPPQRVSADQVMRREYLFVVDVSGSMHGFPLNTAKALMGTLLADLKPHESFNILFFSGGASVLAEQPLTATPANIARATAMMQSFEGGGGTELLPALEQAFAMPRTSDTARSIVVVSDGFISAERQAYDLIRARRNDTNLFAFGIGSSVNRFLIESLAHAGGGDPFVVTDAGAAGEVSRRFRQYVEAPLLSDIALKGRGVELYDLEPGQIPLMLAERPIVIFGKYRNAKADARLELGGAGAGGAYRVSLPLAEARTGAALLPMLWARQRLQTLSDFAGEDVAANRDEIIKLGLGYSLLTRYTSFVAVDETVVPDAAVAKDVKQPLPLPQGVTELALAREVPEPELFWLGLALALVIGGRALKSGGGHGRT